MANILEWAHIRMVIALNTKKERIILEHQSGICKSGQLLAIMGPTGSGKTTLLNILSGRVVYSRNVFITGRVYYNKQIMDHGVTSSTAVGHVSQDDSLFPFLTVRETLQLACYFHAPSSLPNIEREDRVDKVIRELSLIKSSNTIIGNDSCRGVSGGEYKRVLIGRELIKNPEVLFLDEPTSGLDSFQALSVMESMKTLAQKGKLVISVIHQPRSSIFALFDRLLLLSEGKIMFNGPASESVNYFAELGYVCPKLYNPADFFMDILSIDCKTTEGELSSRLRVDTFDQYWQEQEFTMANNVFPTSNWINMELSTADIVAISVTDANLPVIESVSKPCSSWWRDFLTLIWRSFADIFRNYGQLTVRGGTMLFFAALISLIYQDLGNSQESVQNRTGLLYFILVNQGFSPLINALTTFPKEKAIVTREVFDGSYSFSSYYLGRVLTECCNQIVYGVIYCSIIYWSTGLNPKVDRFFIFLGIILLTTLTSAALGFFVGSISPNAQIANAIGPPVFIILLLYGGFYINASSLPVGSVWVRNLSLVYWGFQGLAINEFRGLEFACNESLEESCIPSGDDQLSRLSFQNSTIAESCWALCVLMVGFFVLGYLGLTLAKQRFCRVHPPTAKDLARLQMPPMRWNSSVMTGGDRKEQITDSKTVDPLLENFV